MRFWLCASAFAAPLSLAAQAPGRPAVAGPANRASELTLAGLRPGKDRLAAAIARYGSNFRRMVPYSDELCVWVDLRRKLVLRVETGRDGVIDSVTVSSIDALLDEPVDKSAVIAILRFNDLITGRGLGLGSRRPRVDLLYGQPSSHGPSTQRGHELELLFYAFEQAPSELPQVLEISLAPAEDRGPPRVVEITLAFHSL